MFGRNADDVVPTAAWSLDNTAYRQIVAFGGTAGEYDFLARGIQASGDRLGGVIDCLSCTVSLRMAHTAGVAVRLAEEGQHRMDDPRIDSRRGMVVHVDNPFKIWSWCHENGGPSYYMFPVIQSRDGPLHSTQKIGVVKKPTRGKLRDQVLHHDL
jgi:hypothetical protein